MKTTELFPDDTSVEELRQTLEKYWGYEDFLPLQKEAMQCAMQGRDSVVVLPTGGGKSLCYQVPALRLPGMGIVVSPLISLMKDQVDALRECGVAAARIDSSLRASQRRAVIEDVRRGEVKILYASPERILSERFLGLIAGLEVSLIAIDEAHCVSMWGHDFRPEYRALGRLKEQYPNAGVHAFTATATPRVRRDIAEALRLESPEVLVGSFDRANLVFRVRPRQSRLSQVRKVLDRHRDESGIIYCLSRKDVDGLSESLTENGYSALPYHAGMSDAERKRNQEAFLQDEVHTIVATVAFGMGIDKSDVRYVIHATMPKSLEHYQQESGRAGRDGLEAECFLFYSGSDYYVWKNILADMPDEPRRIALSKLSEMYNYCTTAVCRHGAILGYFGQSLEKDKCGACDVCLGEIKGMEEKEALLTAQKILSCVARLGQRYGANYTADVLLGSRSERVLRAGHDRLSTYGLLDDYSKRQVRNWVDQLVGQDCLVRTQPYRVLKLTERAGEVLRGERVPMLSRPPKKKTRTAQPKQEAWEDVDTGLFEHLRGLRKRLADQRSVRAYMVFNDVSLRQMAARKPESREEFMEIKGVGEKKCARYAETFLSAIREYEAQDA